MSKAKLNPYRDIEIGGGGFGGGGGPGYRPTPRGGGGGIRILPTVLQPSRFAGHKGSGTGSKPSGSVRSSAAKASLTDRVKAKAKKFGRTKLEESSDAMTDFVRASGPAVPKSFKKLSRAMRREVWSRLSEAQQMDVWGSMKSTPRTSVMQHGGSGKPTSHAKSHQIIEKAIADVKAGKPAPMTAHQRQVRHVEAGKPPKTGYKNNPKQMKSAGKAAEASRQRGRMVDPDSVPF